MLRLMIVYEGIIEILHHNFFTINLGSRCTFLWDGGANKSQLFNTHFCTKNVLPQFPENMMRSPKFGLMLSHRRRRWASMKPTLGRRLVFFLGLCRCRLCTCITCRPLRRRDGAHERSLFSQG